VSAYVFCATLHDVQDVFNIENLWTRARRQRPRGQFLRDALADHLRTPKSRHGPETYFSHIIVQIPNDDYVLDDDQHAGHQTQMLLADLQECHQTQLSAYVAPGEDIRYRIEPHPTLPAGEVRFLFGPAIYVPSAGETPTYRIFRQTADANQQLGVFYPGQRLALLNGDPEGSTLPVPGWPFGAEASLLLRHKADAEAGLAVAARPVDSLTVQSRPSATRQSFDIHNPAGATLTLLIAPYAAGADAPIEEPTWTPGSAAPNARPRLRVVGAALVRLSSRAQTGLLAWRLAFDAGGKQVPCADARAVARLRIDAEDTLWGEVGDEVTPLSPPTRWSPQEGLALELLAVPDALQSDYCGWLRFTQPIIPSQVPAVGQWFCFGRGERADVAPALFNDAHALQWATTQPLINQPEQMLLSNQHVRLRADARGWTVKLASQTWPVYVLDAAGALQQTLAPAEGEHQQPAERGALLIVGGYVLELG